MMWDEVFTAIEEALLVDAELVAALGVDVNGLVPVYRSEASRQVVIPSVVIFGPVDDREEELFNPIHVQIDYWARGAPSVGATIERCIRRILHRDTAREFGGFRMWTLFLSCTKRPYPEAGVAYRSLDFMFRPLRSMYETLES